ncbi:MAG: hypothetical protein ABSB82_06585 [Terriglobia bacterium]
MPRPGFRFCGFLFFMALTAPLRAADPDPVPFNPLKGLFRVKLTAEAEVYTGGIAGQGLGAAYRSFGEGDYGLRFTFGFLKSLSFSANYMYSPLTRTLTEGFPPIGGLPSGTVVLRSKNVNMVFGNGEFNLIDRKHTVLYLSPGVGFARNGSRDVTFTTPLGSTSFPVGYGTAVTFNLGAGVKVYPRKHWGVRFDIRDFVSGGGTGNLSPQACIEIFPPPPTCTPQTYLGQVPVNNNLVFTVGLIFKII